MRRIIMGLPVLIIGKSGAGKSASLRKFQADEVGLINVLGKPLPFKNNIPHETTDDYAKITGILSKCKAESIVIDDAGYLIANMFMRGHGSRGKGNAVFELYNDIAGSFWQLIESIKKLPFEKIVYLMMHEDKNDFGDIKPKTIGRLLDDKVCVEGLFTILLRAVKEDGKHFFLTASRGYDVSKTPMQMFESSEIENDLKMVDTTIRQYYGIGGTKND